MKTKIEIKNRWTGSILFEFETENNSVKKTVEEAIKSKANLSKADLSKADLSWANLSKANLSWANLSWANLSEANLSRADLSEANLSKANLSWANLSWANLSEANLSRANLSEANLSEANLSRANLSWANLSEANLSRADLSEANLSEADLSKADLSKANLSEADLSIVKNDFFMVLLQSKNEVGGLKDAILNGKVKGSTYTGDCCCLVGTIANVAKCDYNSLPLLKPNADRPIERFFLGINGGDTPETNKISKIVFEWVTEFELLIK